MGVQKTREPAALGEGQKAYRTSDNTRYIMKVDQDISELITHCETSGLTLTEESTGEVIVAGKEVELKSKKKSKS